MKIITEKKIVLDFCHFYYSGRAKVSLNLRDKEMNCADSFKKACKEIKVLDDELDSFSKKYGITFPRFISCLAEEQIDFSEDSEYARSWFSENFSIASLENMKSFFVKKFFSNHGQISKIRFSLEDIAGNKNDNYLAIFATITTDVSGYLEFEGIRIKELKDNLLFKKELQKREEKIEEEVNKKVAEKLDKELKQIALKEAELKEQEQRIIEKQNRMLAGFQASFQCLSFKNLNDLQSAKFLSDDEKRIICGLLPREIKIEKN